MKERIKLSIRLFLFYLQEKLKKFFWKSVYNVNRGVTPSQNKKKKGGKMSLEYLKTAINNYKVYANRMDLETKEAAREAVKSYFFAVKTLNLQSVDMQTLLQEINNAFNVNFTENNIKTIEQEIKQKELEDLQQQLQKQQKTS